MNIDQKIGKGLQMFKTKKKNKRNMYLAGVDTLSPVTYNGIIGATLLYGFIVNALMVLFCQPLIANVPTIPLIIGYFVSVVAGSIIANVAKKPILSFVGYTLVVLPIGSLLTLMLPSYGAEKILLAIVLTGCVTAIMMTLSMMFPRFFSRLGVALFVSLLVAIVVEIIAILLGYRGDFFNWLFVGLFSLYIGYDWHKATTYTKTAKNAINATIDLYLDVINIFVHLLDLLDN